MNKDRLLTIDVVSAFVDGKAGGNPAGILLDADGLDQRTKQAIATAAGLSETAFVSRSDTADFKLEFFTPTQQIAHCGHATVATFSHLVQQGRVRGSRSSKETIDGNRSIYLKGEFAFMEQRAPRYRPLTDAGGGVGVDSVMASLSLNNRDLLPDLSPVVANTGNSFLLIPLASEAALAAVEPVQEAIKEISEALDLIGYYPFTPETQLPGRDAAARMFAPRFGIPEESATGMAAGPLACYLYDRMHVNKRKIIVEQGRLMPEASPSEIIVELALVDGHITRLSVGGRARVLGQVQVALPLT